MRALKARDAMRAKTASAAEAKWKEKIASERGGEFAVIQEQRRRMFEQQRQSVWLTFTRKASCSNARFYVHELTRSQLSRG
jgi:hypothetical protein